MSVLLRISLGDKLNFLPALCILSHSLNVMIVQHLATNNVHMETEDSVDTMRVIFSSVVPHSYSSNSFQQHVVSVKAGHNSPPFDLVYVHVIVASCL